MTRRRSLRTAVVLVLAGVVVAAGVVALAARAGTGHRVRLTPIAALHGPTVLAARPGDGALFVGTQRGRVYVVAAEEPPRLVMDISREVAREFEQGLIGLTFSPDGTRLYVNFTDRQNAVRVHELVVDGEAADLSTRREVLAVEQPQETHNGGQLAFGPDGYLYIGLGDGGNGGDTGPGHVEGGNAQSLTNLLGTILRVDPSPDGELGYTVPPDNPFVGRPEARPEIWAYGLRNPWRFSFDPDTGDLWIGDVGEGSREEVNRALATQGRDAGKGANYEWNLREGTHRYRGAPPAGGSPPIYDYETARYSCAVIGGYVYRGSAIAWLRGSYVFGDFCMGRLRALEVGPDGSVGVRDLGVQLPSISSLGEGADRELYVLSPERGVFRIDPR